MNPLFVLALLLLILPIHDALRRPSFRRLAVRNLVRRKGESTLVVAGAMLGTSIICASFIVGDTLDASIRDIGRTQLGPIDEVVTTDDHRQLPQLERAATAEPIPGADGVLTMVSARAAVASVGADRRAEPNAVLKEVDFEAARRFGRDAATTGLAGAGGTPGGSEAVLNDDLAAALEVEEGDPVEVFAYGTSRPLTVRTTVPMLGLAGYGSSSGSEGTTLFVAPGTIDGLFRRSRLPEASPPAGEVLVSNRGGVFDGAIGTPAIVDELERRTAGIEGASVHASKQDLLDEAEDEGQSFTELFGAIGGFSVIAGVLLLVLIFLMLAEERKSELGILRAIGLRRNHLLRAFGLEGAIYSIVAAAVGALLGVGVGWVIVQVTAGIFSAEDDALTLRFAAEPASLLTGLLVGLVISLTTVWVTCAWVSRLNVIRAIRDLPEPRVQRERLRTVLFGIFAMALGGLMFLNGVANEAQVPAMAGPAIMLFAAVPVLSRFLPRRPVVTGLAALVLIWGVAAFDLLPEVFESPEIFIFVVDGVVLVSAGVVLVSVNDHIWVTLADRLSTTGRGLAARLAMAYPLARKGRTSMILASFSLIIFTLAFLAVFANIFREQAPQITNEIRAGHHVLVDSNPSNPVSATQLAAQPEVEAVAPLRYGFAEFRTEPGGEDEEFWSISGYDRRLLDRGVVALDERLPRFRTDRQAFEAVLSDPSLALVPSFFLQGGGPPENPYDPGDPIEVLDPGTDDVRTVTVAGIISSDFVFNGMMAGAPFVEDLLGPRSTTSRHYVALSPGVDDDRVSEALNGRFLANGVEAESFRSMIDESLAEQAAFFRLMEGYLGLGLLIGIGGLGVVMVRAVRERRRQIGMLRAMGFASGVVRQAFLLEASFIALQGIALGVSLGVLSSYQLLVNSDAFGDSNLSFSVPWLVMGILIVVPLVAALAATAQPAMQASRIRPAVALRIAD